jgi:hypothetical protein
MADTKISALPSGAPALATDETVIARGGANYKLTVANIAAYIGSGGGTVTSVSGTGTVSGLTLTGTVTTSGNLTLGGTLSVNLATSVTGTLPVANGGTGTSTGSLVNCTADGTNAVGYRNVPRSGSAKTGSYSLATGDVGEFIEVGSGGSVTIPDATFALGDVVSIFNNTSGSVTITCTITTAYIAGTDVDKASVTLATRGVATILFLSGTVCVISGNVS